VLLVRGEVEMFERMARLREPSRREAAILFVDLEGSGTLSRHLPSATYFQLVRTLTSEIDRIVAAAGGVVGRHAGDGASAFFLADEAGSASLAAAAAINAARSLSALGPQAARETGIEESSPRLNVGVHWGSTLYMGQITSGRLEVTALGDEVNACARVQETANGGSVLATKDLLERLDEAGARKLGLDPSALSYVALGEVEGVSAKAVRDAGGLAVTVLAQGGAH
jgi:class 3 adenylate cyclase